LLDDREHAGDGQAREVGREVRDLERRAHLGESGAEELRLRAARPGGEAVEIDEHGFIYSSGGGLWKGEPGPCPRGLSSRSFACCAAVSWFLIRTSRVRCACLI